MSMKHPERIHKFADKKRRENIVRKKDVARVRRAWLAAVREAHKAGTTPPAPPAVIASR